MTLKTTLQTATLCFGLTMFAASCSNEKDSKEVAEETNEANLNKDEEKAADKLVHAYSANLFEIKAAENAAMNASTEDVKKLSAMLIEAHSKMNADVKTLADAKGVTLPADLTEDQRKELEKLAEKTGIDYDKAFTDKMKSKHEDAVKFYDKTAEKCDDPQVKTWASNTAPEVRSHLDMVLMTENAIKDRK
jgi:putative membrane protein